MPGRRAGGKRRRQHEPNGARQGFDIANMEKQIELFKPPENSELTKEQLAELQDLGLTKNKSPCSKTGGQGDFVVAANARAICQGMQTILLRGRIRMAEDCPQLFLPDLIQKRGLF